MKSLAVLILFLSCGQPVPQTPVATRSSEVSLPRVVFPNGYAVHVELAIDEATRAQGLMYRDRLRDHSGMLFFFPTKSIQSFWMKNTLIPLDIIWIDENHRVVHIKHDVPPCPGDPCPGYDPGVRAKYVLEVAAGVAWQQRLSVGVSLRFEGLENVVVR